MVRVFITGSSDGIGQAAAALLAEQGHEVFLHARNAQRAASARKAIPKAKGVLIGDLSSIAETKKLAQAANAAGPFDAIVHNAGIGIGALSSTEITLDNISAVFAVNTLAPYILTSLMDRPTKRLLFVSSDDHYGSDNSLRDVTQSHSYADSKLRIIMLVIAFARRWNTVRVLSWHPGWVKTKMGGIAAPVTLDKPAKALASWAVGQGQMARTRSGAYMTTQGIGTMDSGAADEDKQEQLLRICEEVSGVSIPEGDPEDDS